ncbi:MAG: phosphatidylserine decarboxylase [Candidatus Gorgyraea atricola]|nr:phosphatidylserine decarboxylase [Candidatus Gorgyraea atricola]
MIKRLLRFCHISEDGDKVIIVAFFACILFIFIFPGKLPFFIVVFLFFLMFFRDPARRIAHNPLSIISPADGRVADIDVVDMPDIGKSPFVRIGIFLSILNVHVQRFPYSGEVMKIEYKRGKFYPAFKKELSQRNESNTVVIKTDSDFLIVVKQIAGLIARRIKCKAVVGKKNVKGDRMGIIMFGSRVELYVKSDTPLFVKVGDKVIGGETIIGMMKR